MYENKTFIHLIKIKLDSATQMFSEDPRAVKEASADLWRSLRITVTFVIHYLFTVSARLSPVNSIRPL